MRRNLLLLAGVIVVCIVFMEIALRIVSPGRAATMGRRDAANATKYGWGFDGHEYVQILDPDTGTVYGDTLNAGGWRDEERTIEKAPGTYRIVAVGDSVTYGAVVARNDTWTAQLQRKLRAAGVSAEVINIGYGGWSTDQELEALVREGLAYKPDLVILQFCVNDPPGNRYYTSPDPKFKAWKPFFYELDAGGQLARHDNPLFGAGHTNWHDRLIAIAGHSQILNTLIIANRVRSLRARAAPSQIAPGAAHPPPPYRLRAQRLEHVKLALGLDEATPLMRALRAHLDATPTEAELGALVDGAGEAARREIVMRLLEDRFFFDNELYTPDHYADAAPFDLAGPDWRLTDALLRRVAGTVRAAGARFAILNESDEGLWQWTRYWHMYADTPTNHERALAHVKPLAEIARAEQSYFIPNVRPYERTRNDNHENARGYAAMASDIYDFLHGDLKVAP